jgi:predicted RNA binding protein YcfA (HicA-like mRNA interferase family)
MGDFRPIKTKSFIKFLELHNCYRVGSKSGGSHFYWKKPGLTRRITIREADKEIPPLHIKTNLETLGLKFQDLEDYLYKKKKNHK